VVIYLVKDSAVVEPPYTIELPTGDIIHHFVFQNVKLWEIPPEVLIEQNLPGLLPLLPLTQEGNRREVVEQMISSLQQVGKKELLALGYAFSARMFEQEVDQQWLKEKFKSMEDIFEETWLYQEIEQKGMAKGITKGRAEVLRDMLIHLTNLRFPDLVSQARKQAEQANSQEQLQAMIDKLFTATTVQEARAALMG
jgi:predicted transposase YdaD